MKPFIATAAVCLLLFACAPQESAAQTRSRRGASSSAGQRRRGTPAAGSRLDQARFNTQRLELASLSKDLTRFLYLYGRLSKDLELTAQSGAGDAAGQAKTALVENMRAMRDRLDQLEGRFRFTQGLEAQYQTLQGVSGIADRAAQMVSNNQFDQAGKELLKVSSQLTDVLLEMQ